MTELFGMMFWQALAAMLGLLSAILFVLWLDEKKSARRAALHATACDKRIRWLVNLSERLVDELEELKGKK